SGTRRARPRRWGICRRSLAIGPPDRRSNPQRSYEASPRMSVEFAARGLKVCCKATQWEGFPAPASTRLQLSPPGALVPACRGELRPVGINALGCPGRELEPERFGDDVALDLGGAAVDRRDHRAADEALHVVLGGVAVAAHQLHPL